MGTFFAQTMVSLAGLRHEGEFAVSSFNFEKLLKQYIIFSLVCRHAWTLFCSKNSQPPLGILRPTPGRMHFRARCQESTFFGFIEVYLSQFDDACFCIVWFACVVAAAAISFCAAARCPKARTCG
jgi:hypothetical protein